MACYHDLFFQQDMLTAKREDGTTIRLSRQEHAVLLRLVRHPHTLVTRTELLEALGGKTNRLSERNIDYLVNRLRKRLGDTARDSRFIATRYGQGYVWVADPIKSKPLSAFLLIGPVFGWNDEQHDIRVLPDRLVSSIKGAIDGQQTVLWCPNWRHNPQSRDNLDFTLDLSIHLEADVLHLALVLREGQSQQIIESFRRTCPQEGNQECIDNLAQVIAYALWRYTTLTTIGAEAAVLLGDETSVWRKAVARQHHPHCPDNTNPKLLVMLALNYYERLIESVGKIQRAPLKVDEWQSLEAEIEALTLRALPHAHEDPQLLLAIAKLLRFIDRGYLELAGRLTEEAFRRSTTFAGPFAMKGQIAASRGEISTALNFYDKSIEITEPSSRFHIYLLLLKIFTLMAGGDRTAVYHAVLELNNIAPVNKTIFGLLFIPPNARQLCSTAEDILSTMTAETGRSLSNYLFWAWARQFQKVEHRRNILSGLTYHLQRHHGNTVIVSNVAEQFPKLLSGADLPLVSQHRGNSSWQGSG